MLSNRCDCRSKYALHNLYGRRGVFRINYYERVYFLRELANPQHPSCRFSSMAPQKERGRLPPPFFGVCGWLLQPLSACCPARQCRVASGTGREASGNRGPIAAVRTPSARMGRHLRREAYITRLGLRAYKMYPLPRPGTTQGLPAGAGSTRNLPEGVKHSAPTRTGCGSASTVQPQTSSPSVVFTEQAKPGMAELADPVNIPTGVTHRIRVSAEAETGAWSAIPIAATPNTVKVFNFRNVFIAILLRGAVAGWC
jgi:hypothetical protein